MNQRLVLCTICAHIETMPVATKKKPAPSRAKKKRLVARISQLDKALIEKGAAIAGESVANFVVSRARSAAEELVQEGKVIRLNREESRRLVAALLAPPKPPSAAMKKAMKEYRKSVISDVNPDSPTYRRSVALW